MFPAADADLRRAAALIRNAGRVVAFTGAGISVESGIPPFRGTAGLWEHYDPRSLEIDYFLRHTAEAWQVIREIFYDFFVEATPNAAHRALAELENRGRLRAVITQNIDNLHQEAGSRVVHEFHGNSQVLLCLQCARRVPARTVDLTRLPPQCACGGVYKPDFVFFGEMIPEPARAASFLEAERADVILLIGSTGEVMPANLVPETAKRHGAAVIEVNTAPSLYTGRITDIFLEGKATEVMQALRDAVVLQD
ncbi:MAG: NAD-dependent protein deacylase [Bacteroidota bacterium]|nr:NAD-dependent protein deacylase [Bacteroidota bacterium]